jgi:hypothetical protein
MFRDDSHGAVAIKGGTLFIDENTAVAVAVNGNADVRFFFDDKSFEDIRRDRSAFVYRVPVRDSRPDVDKYKTSA